MNIREEWSPSRNLIELVKDGNGGNFPIAQEGVTIGTPMAIDPSTNNGFNTQMTITPRQESGYTGSYTFRYGRNIAFVPEVVYEVPYDRDWTTAELLTALHRNKKIYLGEITLVNTEALTFVHEPDVRQAFTFQIADDSLLYAPGIYNGEAVFTGSMYPPDVFSSLNFIQTSTYDVTDAASGIYWSLNSTEGTAAVIEDPAVPGTFCYYAGSGTDPRIETNVVSTFPTEGNVTVDLLFAPAIANKEQTLWAFIEDYSTLMSGLFMNTDGTLKLVVDEVTLIDNVANAIADGVKSLVSVMRDGTHWSIWVNGIFLASAASTATFGRPQLDGGSGNFQFGNSHGYMELPMYGKIYRTKMRSSLPYTRGVDFDPAVNGPFA